MSKTHVIENDEITFNKCDSLTYGENVVSVRSKTYSEYEKIRESELKAYLREIVKEILEEEKMVIIE